MRTNTCSYAFCPNRVLLYEHMFCSSRKPEAPRTLVRTLQLVRSFLLLEDDFCVDWEVADEYTESPGSAWEDSDGQQDARDDVHPHRLAL